jgi:hypothetical protein
MLKTGFFRQVRELKIQMKNPGSAFPLNNAFLTAPIFWEITNQNMVVYF